VPAARRIPSALLDTRTSGSGLSRRGFFALAAGGVGGLALAGAVASPAHAADPTPTLPGEYYRKAARVTAAGTVYDNIAVRISGDTARLFVPRGVLPGSATPVVWFYHGAGTDASALENGFRQDAEAVVDRGVVAICQTAGGTLFSHPTAVGYQVAGGEYMSNLFQVTQSVLRSTSAGGALATTAYASRLVPAVTGMYNINATYDLRAAADAGDARAAAIRAIFDDDDDAIDAANPARHPQSMWIGTKMRIIVAAPSSSDTVVPPEQHGLKLRALTLPVAAEASLRTHTNGHSTPGFALTDFQDALDRWGVRDGIPVADTTAPAVSILSPVSGATISGVVTARVSATDAVGVVDVGFFAGSLRLATATKYSDTEWRVTYDTASGPARNGTFSITARATDAAGNVGTSAPVRLTIRN
jgi:hypothetical protein